MTLSSQNDPQFELVPEPEAEPAPRAPEDDEDDSDGQDAGTIDGE